MKISKRDKQILIAFTGILLAVCSYLFVFQRLKPQTEALETENTALTEEVTRLEDLNAKKDIFIKETEEMDAEADSIMKQYAVGISKEDEIMYLTELEHKFSGELEIQYFNMANSEEIPYLAADTAATDAAAVAAATDTTAAAAGTATEETVVTDAPEAGAAAADIKLWKEAVDFGYLVTYQGMKEIIAGMYEEGSRKSIDTIKLAFDTETGNLAGTMQMNFYYLEGTGAEYNKTNIPNMSIGTDNLFHSVDVLQAKPEASSDETGAEENAENAEE